MDIIQLPSGPEVLLLRTDFPTADPLTVFKYWTEPDLLVDWWPQQAEIEPEVGGAYRLSWPQRGWHLRGRYTIFEPGRKLAFTWQWDHTPASGKKVVQLRFEPLEITGSGTQLTLSHEPYSDSEEDQKLRIDDHLAGWLHFLPRLQQLLIDYPTP
ncbi:SRPBCC family protein [Dictyobacter aurantiacus]|uniref:Activator of HSP90 ATPase n=1 Tax=Dictyobacter aurantiacus TaxID=1936993 RepID=A0A401ZJN8_9CHLR|nr:SRPBCC domain-containing protein [Dictyobacter aurantiacus]GCE07059.1 activator of HSP90 ATPase [Dictyobacter aurantiacus]